MQKTVKKAPDLLYPEKAYIAYILVLKGQNTRFFLPFNEIFTDLKQLETHTLEYLKKTKETNKFIPPAPIVFPIKFVEKIPLQEKYWDEPTEELSKTERINNFLKPLENYHFQKLLVTPLKVLQKTLPVAAYCFNLQAKTAEIDFFLSNNYLSMDEKAKFAAIYHFEAPFRYELATKQREKIEERSPKTLN